MDTSIEWLEESYDFYTPSTKIIIKLVTCSDVNKIWTFNAVFKIFFCQRRLLTDKEQHCKENRELKKSVLTPFCIMVWNYWKVEYHFCFKFSKLLIKIQLYIMASRIIFIVVLFCFDNIIRGGIFHQSMFCYFKVE